MKIRNWVLAGAMLTGCAAVKADDGDKEKEVVKENRLAKEVSPYLRLHAKNPVNWYPWGEEAFAKARKENKPILLSIGYSTCHWCHVMERESFEDKSIADYLNKHFVAIKLDREERPDVDKVYMTSFQVLMGQGGGWPLNVFLTPDLKMFYGGTYFPPKDKGRQVGFDSVLKQLNEAWLKKEDEVKLTADSLTDHMQMSLAARVTAEEVPPVRVLATASQALMKKADLVGGGWGGGPKFPQPSNLTILLKEWKRTGDAKMLAFVELTAEKMMRGGIHDHLYGGFHRYAVDDKWLVPHFEKMLYDQAQLLDLYLDLWLITKKPEYRQVSEGIVDYVMREMQSEKGGYYCAQDAQSEGKEGKFCCWTLTELRSILTKDELKVAVRCYGISEKGNFYDFSDPEALKGMNVLSLSDEEKKLTKGERSLFASATTKMRKARSKRVKPATDHKVLSSWNGMMIAAMARAGLVLERLDAMESAKKAHLFIKTNLWREGQLKHRYFDKKHMGKKGGVVDEVPQAQSYLLMLHATRRMYEMTLDAVYLQWAKQLAAESIQLFYDEKRGGFYEAAKRKNIVLRMRGDFDGAMPTASSMAVLEYLKLYELTGDKRMLKVAEMTMRAHADDLRLAPTSLTRMLSGLDFYHAAHQRLVIATPEGRVSDLFVNAVWKKWLPHLTVMGNKGGVASFNTKLIPVDGRLTGYLCVGNTCKLPMTDIVELMQEVEKKE